MNSIAGKRLNNTEFFERDKELFAKIICNGVHTEYLVRPSEFRAPAEAVLMDLDGTTLRSEEFWVYIIEQTMKKLLKNEHFELENADIPFVSGFTTADHLSYCIGKYSEGMSLNDALSIYHRITEAELDSIMKGQGHIEAFTPTDGLKDFLLELKGSGIKIGLATSGLDYKAIPEIIAVFRKLGLGDPREFYDSIITGGKRKDIGDYGTLGEIVSKPHPWIYTELAYMGLKINDRARVVGIEDSAAGIMSLRFAGFSAIGLNGGNITDSGLDSLCISKADTLEEILKIIK